MRALRILILATFAATFLLSSVFNKSVHSQKASTAVEAPTGFDGQSNGMIPQGVRPPEGVEPVRGDYENDRAFFEEVSTTASGLGPVYNAQSCRECHQSPETGGSSQITELRVGHKDEAGNFVDAAGGSLINDRAIDASLQEYCVKSEKIRTFRTSLNTLGDGYVEAIADSTLIQTADAQRQQSRGKINGQVIQVPVMEAPGKTRVGRFGWKNQQASLLSFAGDAYLNEQGITNRLFLTENSSMGNPVSAFDLVSDNQPCADRPDVICGEDTANDIDAFAEFIRATKAPPRDETLAATPDAQAGALLFNQVGCNVCHLPSITTAPAGTLINGGTFTVPEALGNKIIHPYSDFLLHDVDTGDGIVQNGGQGTANKLRTPPLWGLRVRVRLMHDGESLTRLDAIKRHGGEASEVINNFLRLTGIQKNQLLAFLDSL